jgi:hypothetical protein
MGSIPTTSSIFQSNQENVLSGNMFSGEIDPEIAELMGIEEEESSEDTPVFTDLFEEERPEDLDTDSTDADFSKTAFTPVSRYKNDRPLAFFSEASFYKIALSGGGDDSKRLHSLLSEFLNAKDPKDRSIYRQKLIPAYWNVAGAIAAAAHTKLPEQKRYMLRYGYLIPTIISKEQRDMIGSIITDNQTDEPFYYIDEWLREVAHGSINSSATDEVKAKQQDKGKRVFGMIEKARGNRDVQVGLIRSKMAELESSEMMILEKMKGVIDHPPHHQFPQVKTPYDQTQRASLGEILQIIRQLQLMDKELSTFFRDLENAEEQLQSLREQADDAGGPVSVDSKTMEEEFNTVRQMAKMCVGRQGNHFPILMKQYLRSSINDIGTRENVISEMAQIEQLDPGIFLRTFKRQTNRIVPYVVLVPCYGERGICWEPFDRFNRATSRGRVAIPMFPKDLKIAVISALADLRWQVAKEKAQHYWMEEGLTGHYYQWFTAQKLRGDVKEYFIQDYILWITKESEGTQKLEREVRGIFWRHLPFPQELKDELRKRGFVYNELAKKDLNRALSDGY